MVVFLLFIYDMILYYIDFRILLDFMEKRYGEPRYSKLRRNLILLCVSLGSGAILWNSPLGGTYPLISVVLSFAFLRYHSGNVQSKAIFSVIQAALAGYLGGVLLAVLRLTGFSPQYAGVNYIVVLSLNHAVFWAGIFLLKKCSAKTDVRLPHKLLFVLLLEPVSSILVFIFFVLRINNRPDILFWLEFPLLLVFVFINLLMGFLYSQFCALLKRNNDTLLLRQQLDLAEHHVRELAAAQDKVKGIRHDMKNHLNAILFMLRQKPVQTERIGEYIGKLLADVEDAAQLVSTGNLGIDAILSLKMNQVRDKNIRLESRIVIPADVTMSMDESIIIFGNLLDNAMEACEKQPEEKRWIRLELDYIQHSLLIRLSNPLPKYGGKAAEDGLEHGFGLKNVQTVVERHHGTMQIEKSEQTFMVRIAWYEKSGL